VARPLHRLHRRGLAPTLVTVGALLAHGGCGASHATVAISGQWYRVGLVTDLGDTIPFFLRVPDDCETETATVLNGEERLSAPCRRSPVGFVVDFPVYGTQLEAWFKPDGTLVGHWCRERPAGRAPILTLHAEPVPKPDPCRRFPGNPPETGARALVAGDWRMVLDGQGVAKGVFRQDPSGIVTGSITVRSAYGDLRFLAGTVGGRGLSLSTFDGQRAFALDGEMTPDGTLEGRWITQDSRDRFVAERDDDLEMPDPLGRVPFSRDEQRLELEALRDPRFTGKPVIVEIFGTWCPNCNDHAPVLAELYRSYRARGLEILGVAYEDSSEPGYKKRRVQEFKKKHGIEWDVVIADSTLEDLAQEGWAGLTPIEGVPVTIFLNPDHTVHAIYSGFSGPATGKLHQEAKAQFEKLTAEILSSL
jgi:thiol-disulfide isomerase/thioredoxin